MRNSKTQQQKIDELMMMLSSAYQEKAIDDACDYFHECQERQEPTPSEEDFCEYVCETYRDILKSADCKDVYDGFRKYGDECEADFIARKVWQVLTLGMTSKDHHNDIIKKAWKINAKLNAIRKECEALIEQCQEHGDNFDGADYEYQLALLVETLENLANFDLEDSIPEYATEEY